MQVNNRFKTEYTKGISAQIKETANPSNYNFPKKNNAKYVSFYGNPIKPAPFLKETYETIQEFYPKYRESFGETSLNDIKQAANNISTDMGYSRKEILSIMQKLTQFSGIKSISSVEKELKKQNITRIGHVREYYDKTTFVPASSPELYNVMNDNVGLHRTFAYLLRFITSKKTKTEKIAYFLNEEKITHLEKLKETSPDEFKKFKNNKKLHFFYLSGWDNGINFIDRTKNLEDETRHILKYSQDNKIPPEKAIDKPFLKRIKALGITPTIISRDGAATEQCVYNQMAPEKMTKNELFNIIDANSQQRELKKKGQLKIKRDTANYISEQLKVYSPEIMSQKIKTLHEKVLLHAKGRGFEPKDILYVEPEPVKSNSIITYMYKMINKLPEEQFANVREIINGKVSADNKLVVYIDDCTISGDSLDGAVLTSRHVFDRKHPKLFVCLCATSNAIKLFKNRDNSRLIVEDVINGVRTERVKHSLHLKNHDLDIAMGLPGYSRGDATCVIFPYMTPDNSTEFGSNLAQLHNYAYRLCNPYKKSENIEEILDQRDRNLYFYGERLRRDGIKNYTPLVENITKHSNKLIGYSPEVIMLENFVSDGVSTRFFKEHPKLNKIKEWFKQHTHSKKN